VTLVVEIDDDGIDGMIEAEEGLVPKIKNTLITAIDNQMNKQ